jgi:hypothetical protein
MELWFRCPVENRGGFCILAIQPMSDVSHPKDYERSDADPRLVGAIAGGLAIFLIAVPLLMLAMYPGSERLGRLVGNLPLPPQPRLQANPKIDLDRLRTRENEQLNSFGWADRERQLARIPIERAIELLAGRGRDGWPSPAPQH